jgi:hypothetical protein
MANKKFLLAILAIVLTLGMAAVGCSKGSKGGEADGGGEPGTLTITGLPKQEFFIYVQSADKETSSFMDIALGVGNLEGVGTLITPDGNVFQLYSRITDNTWTATGKRQVVLVGSKYNEDNPMDKNNPMFRTATVNFRNGSATVKFGSFTAVTEL